MNLSRPAYWSDRRLLSWALFPLSLVYRVLVWLRLKAYRLGVFGSWASPVPVIIVGNITAGGAGKTPLVIALADLLAKHSFRVGIVSRGYGGSNGREPLQVTPDSDSALVGDEAIVLARRSNAPVVVCADRVAAVKKLLHLTEVDCILSDDGMQHYALQRNLEIAVVDSDYQFGNGFCLPAGPLREPVSRLSEVNQIVYSGRVSANEDNQLAAGYYLVAEDVVCLNDQAVRATLESFAGNVVHAVAGIAAPERFFKMLRSVGIEVIEHAQEDHATYTPSHFEFQDNHPVLMTEKDMVKCTGFDLRDCWYVPVAASLDTKLETDILRHLEQLFVLQKKEK